MNVTKEGSSPTEKVLFFRVTTISSWAKEDRPTTKKRINIKFLM
jgi:hypothetical protein